MKDKNYIKALENFIEQLELDINHDTENVSANDYKISYLRRKNRLINAYIEISKERLLIAKDELKKYLNDNQ